MEIASVRIDDFNIKFSCHNAQFLNLGLDYPYLSIYKGTKKNAKKQGKMKVYVDEKWPNVER